MTEYNAFISSLEGIFNKQELTKREKQAAALLMEGLSNNEIAEKLLLSPVTVKTHVSGIYRKFKVKSRPEFMVKMFKEMKNINSLPDKES